LVFTGRKTFPDKDRRPLNSFWIGFGNHLSSAKISALISQTPWNYLSAPVNLLGVVLKPLLVMTEVSSGVNKTLKRRGTF
jgi:hypothetical protein